MSRGVSVHHHAFISYVREDGREVDRIQEALQTAGVRVWRDTENLWPGEDWRFKIKQAITSDSLVFVACFSDRSASRTTTYQNEELLLAIEQLRQRRPDQPWLIPVRLSDCALPQFDLGAGRTLDSLQRVDVFGDRSEKGMGRLVAGVLRLVSSLEATQREETSTAPPFPPTRSMTPQSGGVSAWRRPIRLREAFDGYRSELRSLVAQAQMQLGSLQAANDSDGIRHLAGAVAEEISKYLAAVASLDEDQSRSRLYDKLLRLGQSAAALSRMRMYNDGGRSWNALNKGVEEVLSRLLAFAAQDWIELSQTKAKAPNAPAPPDSTEGPPSNVPSQPGTTRNKIGSGHGRPFLPDLTPAEIRRMLDGLEDS